jgi:hypothetical protein
MFVGEYSLRPLVRYKYLSHHNEIYRLLKKGFELTFHIQTLVTITGNASVIERGLRTSYVAALFAMAGINSFGFQQNNAFIPSNKWREIRSGIISTTRFNGMLCYKNMRLAVYYIGNGDFEWQAFAEGSLFFRKYGTYESRATGMLLICDGDYIGIAEKILRYTISNRKALLKRTQLESNKKRAYSIGQIRLRPNYEKVYITDKNDLQKTLQMAENEENFVEYFANCLNGHKTIGEDYDIEVHPDRYFVNPQGDLLKFATFFNTVKSHVNFIEHMKEKEQDYVSLTKHHILIDKKFEKIARIYDNLPFETHTVDDNLIGGILSGADN